MKDCECDNRAIILPGSLCNKAEMVLFCGESEDRLAFKRKKEKRKKEKRKKEKEKEDATQIELN